MHDVKTTMGRLELLVTEIKTSLEATLPHLATKVELAESRSEMRGVLAEEPSKVYMWGILTVLLTAYACGLAALAILK